MVDRGQKGGMAAVIRPIGINHADFGQSGVPAFFLEVGLTERNIIQVHCQSVLPDECLQLLPVPSDKAIQCGHGRRNFIVAHKGFGLFKGCFPGLHRVRNIFFNLFYLSFGKLSVQKVDLGRANRGPFLLGNDLDTLGGGIGSLVKLTGQILHGENGRSTRCIQFFADHIQLGLGKDRFFRIVKELLLDLLHIVSVYNPHSGQSVYSKQSRQIRQKSFCFIGQFLFFFYINAINHQCSSFLRSARLPMSCR